MNLTLDFAADMHILPPLGSGTVFAPVFIDRYDFIIHNLHG